MGKKHKKHRKHVRFQGVSQEKELDGNLLKVSIPLNLLPGYKHTPSTSSTSSNQPELSCTIHIQKADLSTFVIPKKKESIDTHHVKKHKKKKHHHHDGKHDPVHHHDDVAQFKSSQSESYSSVKQKTPTKDVSSSLKKLSIVIPPLKDISKIPVSTPPIQESPTIVEPDGRGAMPAQMKPVSVTELLASKLPISQLIQPVPVQPVSHPAQPVTHPVQPVTQPAQPVSQPVSQSDTNEEGHPSKTDIKFALKTIHYQLEKKDPQGIFAEPVTEAIAPGYSSIIQRPMDFSTMSKKIDNLQYQSVNDYKEDFMLMCGNCMTYNPEGTIFYQAAKKLLASGLKLIAKEETKMDSLLNVAKNTIETHSRSSTPLSFSKPRVSPVPPVSAVQPEIGPLVCRIPLDLIQCTKIKHLGVLPSTAVMQQEAPPHSSIDIPQSLDTISLSNTAQWVAESMSAPPLTYHDSNLTKLRVGWDSDGDTSSGEEDDGSHSEVLEQLQAAAEFVHKEVMSSSEPVVDLAYLDTSEAGKAILTILNPDGDAAQNMRMVDTSQLETVIADGEEANKKLELEHSRHKTTPVAYLMYGPYGSFAPYFDSSFATLTRMDSSLLYSVYGDDMGVTYAHSLQRFVRGTGSFTCEMAEAILNGLTSNKHKLLKEKLSEQRDKLFSISQQQQQQGDSKEDTSSNTTPDTTQPSSSSSFNITTTQPPSSSGFSMAIASTTAAASTSNIPSAAVTALSSESKDKVQVPPLPSSSVLEQNVEALLRLQQLQNERLSGGGVMKPTNVVPTSTEAKTALQVVENLKQLVSEATPGNIASMKALQTAMGVTMPTTSSSTTTLQNT